MTLDDIHNKKHIIFDFDKTIGELVVEWSGWHTGVEQIINQIDPDFDTSEIHHFHTDQNDYIRKYGEDFRKEFVRFVERYEEEQVTDFAINQKVVDFIKSLEGTQLSIWSSNAQKTVEKYLGQLGLLEKFPVRVSRDEVKFLKPDPYGFSLIHDQVASLGDYLMVGDSSADEGAAGAAGIDYVHVDELTKLLQ